jgi:Protein of unknown function (DUF2971)
MNQPNNLYRFRPLEDGPLIDRELEALRSSFLYSPSFRDMNDPMEAFYETGSTVDSFIGSIFPPVEKPSGKIYKTLSDMIDGFALISFSSSYENLPMWAYYGSNFAGMCLEFNTAELLIGDLQNEKLHPVTYAHKALPPLSLADMAGYTLEEKVIARITRKRSEWAHEKEWRFLTGKVGQKYYLDNALRRVFLGPRTRPDHAERICQILGQRPVEVLQGEINGYNMTFRSIKPELPHNECERVADGVFDPSALAPFEPELRGFLKVPYERLIDECKRIASKPNMKELSHADISANDKSAMYISTIYELRSGREVYHKSYFDEQFRPINLSS